MCKKERMEVVSKELGFEGCVAVEAAGHSGGLALMWTNHQAIQLLSFSSNHTDVEICIAGHPKFRLTGFYGEPRRQLCPQSWSLIRRLAQVSLLPWCVIGDMNNVLSQDDKRGGRSYPAWLVQGFQDVVADCNLLDMDLMGYPFTWEKGRGSQNWVEVRLDRALICGRWQSLFPHARLVNMEVSLSDHTPLWLDIGLSKKKSFVRTFRFENAWAREPMCRQIIQDIWLRYQMDPLYPKIKCCSTALAEWGRNIIGCFKERITQCNKILRQIKGRRDEEAVVRYKEVHAQLFEVLSQKEVYWKQRSKQMWLQAGDQNTKYFHAWANIRRRRNQIRSLKDVEGRSVDWDSGLDKLMVDYFSELFTASDTCWDRVISGVQGQISEELNHTLMATIDKDEVRAALFQMHPDKSPGPDGFNPGFYQKYWDIVEPDVLSVVQGFFERGVFDDHLMETNIVLIPKKSQPESMSDLRPIALCNIIYKIVSKVLANRLKIVLHHVISESQSAFIPGRLITDNILVSFEVMHYMKRKMAGHKGVMAIKLDMSKAYDRVEWGFLRAMLHKMGLNEHWINLIMVCVSKVKYKITTEGKELGPIIPSRGLRQGDPLSPYLFLICAEGLSALIADFERQGKIKGCKVARTAPVISHMFFADDAYLYCRATQEEATHVMEVLKLFQMASGQQVNLHKSSVFFSANTVPDMRKDICSILNMNEASVNTMYMGLPNILGRRKSAILGFLKDRMRAKIQSWESKFLSKAGKELLIKSVAQSLPSYAMSVFLIPVGLCKDMEQLMCKFWWKTDPRNNRGIHWQNWDKLSIHKSKGGMGFRSLHDFNLAYLSKQGWRLICRPQSLVGRLFKSRYFANGTFLSAELGSNPSYVWRSMFEAISLVKDVARMKVGNGGSIRMGIDPWLPCENHSTPRGLHDSLKNNLVKSLLDPVTKEWDKDLILDLFQPEDAYLILSIPLSTNTDDTWYWALEKSGNFSVKSLYRLLQERREDAAMAAHADLWVKLWKLRSPPKVKDLLWRSSTGCLPTRMQLSLKHVDIEMNCPYCPFEPESITHCLINCPFVHNCWRRSGLAVESPFLGSFGNWLDHCLRDKDESECQKIASLLWSIWRTRNNLVWHHKKMSPASVVFLSSSMLNQWIQAQNKIEVPLAAFLTDADGADTWQKPSAGGIKINVDTAIFSNFGSFSYACIARNEAGNPIEAITSCKQGSMSPELAEVMGIREALSWIKQKKWSNVTIETDCLLVIQALRSNATMASYFGDIVFECKRLSQVSSNISIVFVKRSANKVAHALARASYIPADRIFKVGDIPSSIMDVLLNEV
ncbi:uncharacterized protein LOC133809260 [Humulus lupulus]|uniref:uncharacterized protein LOC133809260 n=1 Tax=Humulus lupulus TaxID=3486 RepID=UPI002B405786|nr:uncharacterized protein LOC133809260 [Humulus lupulus]